VIATSIIKVVTLMREAASVSETLVNFYFTPTNFMQSKALEFVITAILQYELLLNTVLLDKKVTQF
jgi:hypothetical protein